MCDMCSMCDTCNRESWTALGPAVQALAFDFYDAEANMKPSEVTGKDKGVYKLWPASKCTASLQDPSDEAETKHVTLCWDCFDASLSQVNQTGLPCTAACCNGWCLCYQRCWRSQGLTGISWLFQQVWAGRPQQAFVVATMK